MRLSMNPTATTLAALTLVTVFMPLAANAQKSKSKGAKTPAKSTAKPTRKDPWSINFEYKKQNIPAPTPVKNYARALNTADLNTNEGLEPLLQASRAVKEKPALLNDPAWKKRMGDACTDLSAAADKILLIQPVPTEYQPFYGYAKEYAAACKQYATHFKARIATLTRKDFDSLNGDFDKIDEAEGKMGRTMLLVLSQYTDYDTMLAEFTAEAKKRGEAKRASQPL